MRVIPLPTLSFHNNRRKLGRLGAGPGQGGEGEEGEGEEGEGEGRGGKGRVWGV
jgi:hypothetical protein